MLYDSKLLCTLMQIIVPLKHVHLHIISCLLSKERMCVWRFRRFSFAWFLGAAWSFVLLLKTSLGIFCDGHSPGTILIFNTHSACNREHLSFH